MTLLQKFLFNVFLIAGLVLLGWGVCDEFGVGWSKMAVGAILFFGTLYLLLRPVMPAESEPGSDDSTTHPRT